MINKKTAYVYRISNIRKPALITPVSFIVNVPEEITEREVLDLLVRKFEQALKRYNVPWAISLNLGFNPMVSAPLEIRQAWKQNAVPVIAFERLQNSLDAEKKRLG